MSKQTTNLIEIHSFKQGQLYTFRKNAPSLPNGTIDFERLEKELDKLKVQVFLCYKRTPKTIGLLEIRADLNGLGGMEKLGFLHYEDAKGDAHRNQMKQLKIELDYDASIGDYEVAYMTPNPFEKRRHARIVIDAEESDLNLHYNKLFNSTTEHKEVITDLIEKIKGDSIPL